MGYLQKKENRNAAKARDSFVTKKAEQKLSVLTDTFKRVSGKHLIDERRDTLQRTLYFNDFKYLSNLKFIYNWENRFLSVNYNLQMLGFIDVNESFREIGKCKFKLEFSMKRHKNDIFVCRAWNDNQEIKHKYLERLNNILIIDRVHTLDIQEITIQHRPEWGNFRVSVDSFIGSGAWIFIPPVMQLITPKEEECVRFLELFELIGDAIVNNKE